MSESGRPMSVSSRLKIWRAAGVESFTRSARSRKIGADVGRVDQVLEIVVGEAELLDLDLELLIDGRQLLVDRLQLLLAGLELLGRERSSSFIACSSSLRAFASSAWFRTARWWRAAAASARANLLLRGGGRVGRLVDVLGTASPALVGGAIRARRRSRGGSRARGSSSRSTGRTADVDARGRRPRAPPGCP